METIGFIGAGQMARALAQGFVRAGLTRSADLVVSDPASFAGDAFVAIAPGARLVPTNVAVAELSTTLFLAVKPQQIAAVTRELHGRLTRDHLVVSIAAGVTLAALEQGLGGACRLIRVMPNAPCLVGQSASGYCLGSTATEADGAWIDRMFSAVGRAFRVEEKLLDAVTGLSGSGPAFVYVMIEALADGGVLCGLPRDVALALAAQTVRGAAEMVLTTGEHPGALKDRVASPGGTTIAGLAALEGAGVRSGLMAAVEAATLRSAELGRREDEPHDACHR
jgi:pyrroline-5-carboxylate reductase